MPFDLQAYLPYNIVFTTPIKYVTYLSQLSTFYLLNISLCQHICCHKYIISQIYRTYKQLF